MNEIKNEEINAVTGAGANCDLQRWLTDMLRELAGRSGQPADPYCG